MALFSRQPFSPIGQIWEMMVRLLKTWIHRRTEVCWIWRHIKMNQIPAFKNWTDRCGWSNLIQIVQCWYSTKITFLLPYSRVSMQIFQMKVLKMCDLDNQWGSTFMFQLLSVNTQVSASLFWFGKTEVSSEVSACVCISGRVQRRASCAYTKRPVMPLTVVTAKPGVGWLRGRWSRTILPLRFLTLRQFFLAGLHGNGHANTAPSGRHVRHLWPCVLFWVVTLHAVQESVAIVTSCEHNDDVLLYE